MIEEQFWKKKSLDEMNGAEWEALCDGCGKCCLNKLEDEDTGDIVFTNVACELFNLKTCRCDNYKKRRKIVKDCHQLTPKKVRSFAWLPSSCAYKVIERGGDLPSWHHLVSGHRNTVHNAGASVKGRVVPEREVKDMEDHVVDWIT